VIDAFNGRVDAILSRAKHDNYGTLEQEIRDAFSLVNLNGQAFRNARILPAYLDARLAELKWAAVVQELAWKQREEQRYLKERLRDEEKARKEYEEKMRQAAKEEELKRRAVEETEQKVASATMEQKAYYEQELQRLRQELADATQRALTIAQQTKKGHVYIISNVGSFGEGVYKIGLTRRPEPQDRVDELGGASVPFEFDVHALIESENAPALEHKLHKQLLPLQLNKINSRKEFFRVGLADIHREVEKLNQGEDFTVKVWTEKAIATEYRDSLDIENDPQKKENWVKRQQAWSARQLQLDMLKFPVLSTLDTDDDNQET
jgi:glucan-binding YG repeat protein